MDDYTKRCSLCKQDLPYSAFALKDNKPRDTFCRECKKAYQRKHYADNNQYYKDRATVDKESIREYIRGIKATMPCADCGRKFHYCVMDFDHREGETKLFEIAHAYRTKGRIQIEQEMAKCDVVCANCHRIRTHGRAGHPGNPKSLAAKKRRGLTPHQVDQALILHATGRFTHRQIAARFGVHRSSITHLLSGRTHKKRNTKVNEKGSDLLKEQCITADTESSSKD